MSKKYHIRFKDFDSEDVIWNFSPAEYCAEMPVESFETLVAALKSAAEFALIIDGCPEREERREDLCLRFGDSKKTMGNACRVEVYLPRGVTSCHYPLATWLSAFVDCNGEAIALKEIAQAAKAAGLKPELKDLHDGRPVFRRWGPFRNSLPAPF